MRRGDYQAGARYGLPAEGPGSVALLRVRLVAYAVDLAVLSLLALLPYPESRAAAVVLAVTSLVVLPVRWGTTLGHAAARLRIVPVVDGAVLLDQRGLNIWTALGRALEFACCGALTPLFLLTADRDRRTLFDRWSGTAVVEW